MLSSCAKYSRATGLERNLPISPLVDGRHLGHEAFERSPVAHDGRGVRVEGLPLHRLRR